MCIHYYESKHNWHFFSLPSADGKTGIVAWQIFFPFDWNVLLYSNVFANICRLGPNICKTFSRAEVNNQEGGIIIEGLIIKRFLYLIKNSTRSSSKSNNSIWASSGFSSFSSFFDRKNRKRRWISRVWFFFSQFHSMIRLKMLRQNFRICSHENPRWACEKI